MAVLSPLSSHAIPQSFRHLMLDENSEIYDFYPSDFFVDVKGKRFAWLGEVILPFIDEERLLNAISKYETLLTVEELERNKKGNIIMYSSSDSKIGKNLVERKN